MKAKDIIKLVCEKKEPAPYWTHARGIYADLSSWPDSISYYAKCPKCGHVHGTYKSMAEVRAKRLCPECDFKNVEKIKKELHHVRQPASMREAEEAPDLPDESELSPQNREATKAEVERYTTGGGNWVEEARWSLENLIRNEVELDPDKNPNYSPDFPEAVFSVVFIVPSTDTCYKVWKSDNEVHNEAVQQVERDIEEEPGNFNQNWLQNFVDCNKLRQALDLEDGEDPWDYLENMVGEKEAIKQAIDMVGIDYARAAKSAVSGDGWQHYLSSGEWYSSLNGGAVAVEM